MTFEKKVWYKKNIVQLFFKTLIFLEFINIFYFTFLFPVVVFGLVEAGTAVAGFLGTGAGVVVVFPLASASGFVVAEGMGPAETIATMMSTKKKMAIERFILAFFSRFQYFFANQVLCF